MPVENSLRDRLRIALLILNELNSFPANAPILYCLETPENLRFSGIFRGYKIGTLAGNGLSELINFYFP